MLVAAKMKPIKAALYIIFQCLGGIAGASILKVCGTNYSFFVVLPEVTLSLDKLLNFQAFTPELIQGSLGMTEPNKASLI